MDTEHHKAVVDKVLHRTGVGWVVGTAAVNSEVDTVTADTALDMAPADTGVHEAAVGRGAGIGAVDMDMAEPAAPLILLHPVCMKSGGWGAVVSLLLLHPLVTYRPALFDHGATHLFLPR